MLVVLNILILLLLCSLISMCIIKNPVHTLLSLILFLVNYSILLLFLGVEFMGFLIFIIYIGAIVVLFLFVVMLLNIRSTELGATTLYYLPLFLFLFLIFALNLFIFINTNIGIEFTLSYTHYTNWFDTYYTTHNVYNLSNLIYTYFFIYFFVSGLILLVAILGTILITLNKFKTLTIAQEAKLVVQKNFNIFL